MGFNSGFKGLNPSSRSLFKKLTGQAISPHFTEPVTPFLYLQHPRLRTNFLTQ